MDKPAKRRVLSLSLSQPSKQQRKHKLKRHVSASSSKAIEEPSNSKRDGSNSPTIKSHNPPTRIGSFRQSDSEDGELPTKASESKVPGLEGPELQSCNGPMEDASNRSDTDCLSEKHENENVCNDKKCKIPSEISDNSPTTPILQSIDATVLDTNHSEVSCQKTGENIGCETRTTDVDLEVLQCPLCLKTFDKLPSKTTHIKSCASKRKLPTNQLIEILELQKRQAAERRALGLPNVLPVPVAIKKSASLKKETRKAPKMDSNLQLAMALSLSMQDQIQAVEQVNITDTARELSLERFGFTTKSVLEAAQGRSNIPSSRGKANTIEKMKPILLSRTAEERQQIITEKVAMVLLEESEPSKREKLETVNLKSTFLQEVLNKENMLWSKAYTSPSKNDRASYYVPSLRGFISPSKVEMGSKVMHLSQVVGRVKTPTKDVKQKLADEVVSTSHSEECCSSDASSPPLNETKNPAHIEMKLRAKLFNDWAGMVNNSTMSDLMIYPQEGREIPTHKLILSVRCPRILKDISKQCNSLTGNHVEVVMWSKTPHAAALAFLEYVYCGSVKSIRVLSGDLSSVTWLATHYKISDLLQYLCAIKEETCSQTASQVALNVIRNIDYVSHTSFDFKRSGNECEELNENNSIPTKHSKDSKPSCIQSLPKPLINQVTAPSRRASPKSETESIYSEITTKGSEVHSRCSSPDLFGDEDTAEIQDKSLSENSNVLCSNGMQYKCPSTIMLPLKSDFGTSERPPSANSISSEKTVVCENMSSHSHGSSIASANNDILEKDVFSASPASSLASADTEILDLQKHHSKKLSLLSNESKRKLSNSSQDGDKSAPKRLCPHVSEKNSNEENTDSLVDFFDLTQDSDSSVSPAAVKKSKSLDSCDKVCISSDSELHYQEASKEHIVEELCEDVIVERSCSAGTDHKSGLADKSNDETPFASESIEPVKDAYVSPVWDGFEDLNYDDQFFFAPQPTDMNDQQETASVTSLSSNNQGRCDSPAANSIPHVISEPKEGKAVEVESSSDSEPSLKPIGNANMSSGFDALLDESLNINDTILQHAECGKLTQRETRGTPVNRILSSVNDPAVTPLANYSAMKTPELKRELQKFGLKPTLGKRKGKIMLRHIYNELHPWVPGASNERFPKKCSVNQPVDIQAPSQSNSRKLSFLDCDVGRSDAEPVPNEGQDTEPDSDSDSSDRGSLVNTSLQEIQFMEESCEDVQMCSQALHPANKNLREVVYDFITKDSKLHQKVLEYEPIWIEKLHTDLRNKGYKFKMEDIMSYLDEKCITFRTTNSGSRVKKRKQKTITTKKKISATENPDSSEQSN